jgi:DNA-binding MarR family transcriptional regulator
MKERRLDDRHSTVFRINRLSSSLGRAAMKFYSQRFNLGVPHVRVIYTISDHGSLASKEIVEITAMDKALVSRVLSDMTNLGFVKPTGENARNRIWALTNSGLQFVATINPVRQSRQEKLLGPFSNDDVRVLNKLLDRLFLSSEQLRLEEEEDLKTNRATPAKARKKRAATKAK